MAKKVLTLTELKKQLGEVRKKLKKANARNRMQNRELAIVKNERDEFKKKAKECEAESRTDFLTGLVNRRGYYERMVREVQRAQHQGHALTGIGVDMKRFKYVNDTYGHPVGDKILKRAAEVLLASVRPGDMVARVGGDEFFILLPQMSEAQAEAFVTRLEGKVQTDLFVRVAGSQVRCSVSCGVAELRNGETLEEFLKRVDDRLGASKSQPSKLLASD